MNSSPRTNGRIDIVGPDPEEKARLQSDHLSTLVRRLAEGFNQVWRKKVADVTPATIASEVSARFEGALLSRVMVRIEVVSPGSMVRTEVGKVQRVFEQIDNRDPLD